MIPPQSTPGATETYKLRVPSEGGRTTTAVVLTVPDGVTITSVTAPEGAKHEEKRTGDRIVDVTWTVEIKAGARAELPFVATNPAEGSSITWKVIQKYSDGSSSAWVGPRGDRAPAPVMKLAVAAHETDSMKIPDSLEGIFKVIYEKHAALTNDVRNKNLKAVHTRRKPPGTRQGFGGEGEQGKHEPCRRRGEQRHQSHRRTASGGRCR